LVLAALAYAISLVIPDVLYNWDHDAGYYLSRSMWIARGLRPWIDYSEVYTPFVMILNAIPMALGLPPIAASAALTYAWIAANAVGTYALARAWSAGRLLAVALTAFYLIFQWDNQGTHVTLEHGLTFFTILSLIQIRKSKTPRGIFISGVFAGLAFFSKQVGVITIIPFFALFFGSPSPLSPKKVAICWFAGYAAVLFAIFAYVGFSPKVLVEGWLRPFFTFGMTNDWPGYSVIDREMWRSPVTFALLGGAFVLAGLDLVSKSATLARKLATISITLTLVLYFLPRIRQDYLHYTLNCWPFAAILLTYPLGKWSKGRAWLVPLAVTCVGLFNMWTNLPSLNSIGYFSRAQAPGWVFGFLEPIAKRVRELVPPGSSILVIGEEPMIEFLSGMKPQDLGTEFLHDYSTYQDLGNLTVLVDHGQAGIAERRTQLAAKGYHREPFVTAIQPMQVEIWVK